MRIKLSPKKVAYWCFALAVTLIISSYVGGPPPATTNAPSETTCSTNGLCHAGPANHGPGFADITIDGGIPLNGYTPGQTYMLMPYLVPQDTAMIRSGFEVVALLQSNGNAAGNVVITDPSKTQLVIYNNKQYTEQTAAGAITPGMHDWMYNWTAPPVGSGTVIFYGAFVAGNGDGTSSGDYIYTDSLVLPENTTGINENAADNGFIHSLFPNPATTSINIEFSATSQEVVLLTVYSMDGRVLYSENVSILPHHFIYTIPIDNLPLGVYLISVRLTDDSEKTLSLKRFIKL